MRLEKIYLSFSNFTLCLHKIFDLYNINYYVNIYYEKSYVEIFFFFDTSLFECIFFMYVQLMLAHL